MYTYIYIYMKVGTLSFYGWNLEWKDVKLIFCEPFLLEPSELFMSGDVCG